MGLVSIYYVKGCRYVLINRLEEWQKKLINHILVFPLYWYIYCLPTKMYCLYFVIPNLLLTHNREYWNAVSSVCRRRRSEQFLSVWTFGL